MRGDHARVDASAEVVDVREQQRADAARAQLVHRREDREVAVARAVGRRPGKELAVGREAERDRLREHDHVLARPEMLARLVVGREAVHQDDRQARARASRSFQSRNDTPSTASTRPLTAPPKRVAMPPLSTATATPSRSASASSGQLDELVRGERLDLAADVVRLLRQLAARDALPQLLEPELVEAERREDLLDGRAQVPSSHEARYFACSSVSWSISTPIVASLRRAISASISAGTG